MREIEFRGICLKTNEWIYGFYFYSMEQDSHMILTLVQDGGNSFDEAPSDHQEGIAVDPDTIGQFLNIECDQGENSYQGDIVEMYGKIILLDDLFEIGRLLYLGPLITNEYTKLGTIHTHPNLLTKPNQK